MSSHYLVDPFSLTRDVIDVTRAEAGGTDSTGALLIRIPDGVAIHGEPKDLPALLTAKYNGLLAYYAGFTTMVHDDCLTQSGVSLANSAGVSIGAGVANHCVFDGGSLVTSVVGLSSAPQVCVVVWEAYSVINVDPSAGRFTRVYLEEDPDLFDCSVTFDGVTSNPASSGAVLSVPVGQGTNLSLTFANNTGARLFLGSWAVIY